MKVPRPTGFAVVRGVGCCNENLNLAKRFAVTQRFISQSCSASALQARLKVAAHEAEEESDIIAEDFLEGKMEIDDFLSNFMEKRTVGNISLKCKTFFKVA